MIILGTDLGLNFHRSLIKEGIKKSLDNTFPWTSMRIVESVIWVTSISAKCRTAPKNGSPKGKFLSRETQKPFTHQSYILFYKLLQSEAAMLFGPLQQFFELMRCSFEVSLPFYEILHCILSISSATPFVIFNRKGSRLASLRRLLLSLWFRLRKTSNLLSKRLTSSDIFQ